MINNRELMNVKQTAEYLNVSVHTIYQWKSEGKIPYVKLNGKLCFDKSEINLFIEKCMNCAM